MRAEVRWGAGGVEGPYELCYESRMMRIWHHLLVFGLIAGLALPPGVAYALSSLGDDAPAPFDRCCPGDSPVEEAGEQAQPDDGCSWLCVGFCCPMRTLADASMPPAASLAEGPWYAPGAPGDLAAGFVRAIEHPPSL